MRRISMFLFLFLFLLLAVVLAVAGPPSYYRLRGFERPLLPEAGRAVELRDGTRLNVLDTGRGEPGGGESPIVLVHGLPGSGYDWKPLQARLAAEGRRVIAYDRKGYGHSDIRSQGEPHTVDANASELLELLDRLDLGDVTLVGWSYGGGVSIVAAVRNSTRIARVVLLASIGPMREQHSPGWIEGLVFSGPVLAWVGSVPPVSTAVTTALSREAFSDEPMPDWWVPQMMANLARPGARRALQREEQEWRIAPLDPEAIGRPVLVIHGTEDRSLPISVGEDLHARTQPESEMLRVEGGSHMLPITHTKLLAERILSFSSGKVSSRD